MIAPLQTFANNESGAVTVDWVVLTAALVGLALAVLGVVSGGVEDVARDVDDVTRQDIVRNSFGADGTTLGLE